MNLLTAIFLIIITLAFVIQNLESAWVNLFSWRFQLPPALIAVFALIIGIYLANIWHAIMNISSRKLFRAFSQKIIEMEKEIEELKKTKDQVPHQESKTDS
jgi:uncharacterized integral membrane protein